MPNCPPTQPPNVSRVEKWACYCVLVVKIQTDLHCLIIFIQFSGSFISGREAKEAINNCWANTGSSLLARPQTIQKRGRGSAALIKWNKVRWWVVGEEWLRGLYLVSYLLYQCFHVSGTAWTIPSLWNENGQKKSLSRLHPNKLLHAVSSVFWQSTSQEFLFQIMHQFFEAKIVF